MNLESYSLLSEPNNKVQNWSRKIVLFLETSSEEGIQAKVETSIILWSIFTPVLNKRPSKLASISKSAETKLLAMKDLISHKVQIALFLSY